MAFKNLLSFTDVDGNSFNLYEDKIVSAFDNGTNHVLSYKDHVDGIPQSVQITDASFTAAVPSFSSLISVTLADDAATNVEYINTDRISVIEASGTNTVITFDNGSNKEQKVISSTLAEFTLLLGSALSEITITLTSAQILALNTTPIELIGAPGAGKYIVVEQASASIDFNTTAYVAAGNMVLSYTDASGTATAVIPEALVEATADRADFNLQQASVQATFNAALVAASLTSDPTAGDSEITVNISYRIETI